MAESFFATLECELLDLNPLGFCSLKVVRRHLNGMQQHGNGIP